MNQRYAVSVDLGTTNSALATMNGRLVAETIPGEDRQLPSMVFVPEKGEPLCGMKALRAAYRNPSRLYTHFKRGMVDGQTARSSWHGGPTPIELTSTVLKQLLTVLLAKHPELESWDGEVVYSLSHPAGLGVEAREALREVAQHCGLDPEKVQLVEEPVAAASRILEEHSHSIHEGQRVLIVDVGGGTTDITALELTSGRLDVCVGATGDDRLGGDNFTGAIFQQIAQRWIPVDCFSHKTGLDLTHKGLKNDRMKQAAISLWGKAAELKLQLSAAEEATVFVEGKRGPIDITLTRQQFETICESLWSRFETVVGKSLAGSELSFSDLDVIVVAGGSSMLPGIRDRVARATQRETSQVLISSDSSHVVAGGGAILAYNGVDAARSLPRGLALVMRQGGTANASRVAKFFLPTGAIVPAEGTSVQDLGQFVESPGGTCTLQLQFAEAKPGITVAQPEAELRSVIDDSEVVQLDLVQHQVELPAGRHEVQAGFSLSEGATLYSLGFPSLPEVEPLSGRLSAKAGGKSESAETPPQDVILMLDTSGSMSPMFALTKDQHKLAQAKRAICSLVKQTAPQHSLALIRFGVQATCVSPLGSDRSKLLASLDELAAGGGTPMSEALDLATEHSRPDRQPTLGVLVTDGVPNDPRSAEQLATRFRDRSNVELICIGIGSDVDEAFLRRIASEGRYYFGEAKDLGTIFSTIVELYL